MNQEQALQVLIQAAQLAQSKGAYSLQEAGIVATAIESFTKKEEEKEEKAIKEVDKED